ncbi:unnamed protein product [Fusarium fujikuroi]|nr:unnamed protein product [Fusarium fujikuroi]
MDQPKPLSSLKDSLPHGEKDNSSSYVPQEVAGPAGSEDSDEDARLDELPHEELINNERLPVEPLSWRDGTE